MTFPAVIALAAFVTGQGEEKSPPPPKIPAEIKAEAGRLVRIVAETDSKDVKWHLAGDKADLIPFPGGRTAIFSSAVDGEFVVTAWLAVGDHPSEAAVCKVIVGKGKPPAPGPGPVIPPGPGPNPPNPPGPPNPPTDPLGKLLFEKAMMETRLQPDKRFGVLVYLAETYKHAAEQVAGKDIVTAGQMLEAIIGSVARKLTTEGYPTDTFMAMRRAIADEINAKLDTEIDTVLDDKTRAAAVEVFNRVAKALDSIK